MKIVIILIGILVVLGFIFVKTYQSSPGFTTQEYAEEFYKNAPKCNGFSFVLNKEATYADAPEQSLCIGLLIK